MEHDEWIDHWQALRSSLVVECSTSQESRTNPDDGHLDRLESELGIKLPLSYRTFIRVFGPGRLMSSFAIYAPGFRGATVIDFLANNKWQAVESQRREMPKRIHRLVAFADIGGEFLAWDPMENVTSEECEYRIFKVPKQPEQPLVTIAEGFRAFVEDLCIRGKYWNLIGEEFDPSWEDEDGVTRTEPVYELIGEGPTTPV